MKTFQRFLSSVKGNVEILDLPAGDVDYLLAKFFPTEQILQGWKEFSGAMSDMTKILSKIPLFFEF